MEEEIRKDVLVLIEAGLSPNRETVRAIDMAITLTAKRIFKDLAAITNNAKCDCPGSGSDDVGGCICDLYEIQTGIDKLRIKYEG